MIAAYVMRNPLTVLLVIALVIVGGTSSAGWYLADRDRDAARADLVAERGRSAELAATVARQNDAVQVLAEQKAEAEARGQAAQQLAAANGKRFDLALARTSKAKATTCLDAMPVVNEVLESVR